MSACPFDLDDVNLENIEPYTGELEDLPEEVKDCEKSIREDNPDMDKSTAIAICRDQLDMSNELSGVFQLADVDTEPIERIEEGENTVRYTSIKLIAPGVWTDSASRETIWYSPEGMKGLEVRDDNSVNLMHDDGNEVSEVGSIDPSSIEQTEEGVFGDLVIDTGNAAGEYADENLQTTLESGGAKGFGGPSVEIDAEGQEVEFNDEKGMRELIGGIISGLGLVKNPAAKSVSFARQTAKRGVALADGEQTKVFHQGTRHMADPEFRAQVLSHVDEDFTLQGAMDAIQDDAQAIADELDVGVDEVMEVLDPLLDMEEEEEDMENEDDEEEENEGEDEEEDDDMDMQDRVDALEERLTNVEDMVESAMQAEDFEEELSEELEDAKEELADAETVQELEEAKDDLEKRLSELEEEPGERKTLADRDANEEDRKSNGATRPVARKARDGSIKF